MKREDVIGEDVIGDVRTRGQGHWSGWRSRRNKCRRIATTRHHASRFTLHVSRFTHQIPKELPETYPINLVLDDRLVVLVIAQGEIVHKIPALLECGARIRVIAPTAVCRVAAYARPAASNGCGDRSVPATWMTPPWSLPTRRR
ncbi:MAG: hypothetical protein R2851_20585 [Caldilineaceae bacterium]